MSIICLAQNLIQRVSVRRLRALLVLVPLGMLSTAGFCSPGGGAPKPDRCEPPAQLRLSGLAVEVGSSRLMREDRSANFVAFTDGQLVAYERGFQGGVMLPYGLRLRGTDLPECLPQKA